MNDVRVGLPREYPAPPTEGGSRSSWRRIAGPGEASDFSAGASFDGDFRRGAPPLRIVSAEQTADDVPAPLARPQMLGSAPAPPDVTVSAPQWVGGRYMRFIRNPSGVGRWEELEPPEVDPERLSYLLAKHVVANGAQGAGRLLALVDKIGLRRKGELK